MTIIRAAQLSPGDSVVIRDGNLPKRHTVVAVKHFTETVHGKPQEEWGKKQTYKVPLRMFSFDAWLQAGRPYVNKTRQQRTLLPNTYIVAKVAYKVDGERKWRIVPALTPVHV
jgi:hypothetical protein